MKHDNLIYILQKEFPQAVHGLDFWVAHPISSETGARSGDAFIVQWKLEQPLPTSDEIAVLWSRYGTEALEHEAAQNARAQRDELLRELDAVVSNPLRFLSLDEAEQAALAVYRQALLDVPQQTDFPVGVEWPVRPTSISEAVG